MTNSIASAKCPSVLTSGKYGMSQHRSIIDDSKEYIFVKLTDSAFRAIEEYQRNKQTKRLHSGQCAKIQFLGNSGVIQFPSAEGSNGPADGRKFGFAIDDVEGSLECIQQAGAELDGLGSLNHRMRIHANDDVYDTTRTKMAIAEETEKSKCIREIKPNQTDIGRKVKRPVSAASLQAYTNGSSGNGTSSSNSISSNSINGSSSYLSNNSSSNNSRSKSSSATTLNQHSPSGGGLGVGGICSNGSVRLALPSVNTKSSPNPSMIGGNGTIGNGNSNCGSRYGSPSNFHSSSSLPSMSSSTYVGGGGVNGTALSSNSPPQKKALIGGGSNSRNVAANSTKKSNGSSSNNGKQMDVSRRKIRERLIHLLALKPFKKPELYSRLTNEGLAPKERQLISTILKDISTLSRDNTYNLRRSMWNDVDENWPFFTEQEVQLLKRRKPQNLTPPMSSDAASSTSGQSPTSSIHTGSPPPTSGSNGLNGLNGVGGGGGFKRASLEPDVYDGALTIGVQSKKQRISHYKKDAPIGLSTINCVSNGYSGAGARSALGQNGNVPNAHNNRNNSSSAYSPHSNIHNNQLVNTNNGNDENSGNSDLSFNVLNNMDDFIQQHTGAGGEQMTLSRGKANGKTSNIGNSSSTTTTQISSSPSSTKEKRNSSGSTSSSSGYCSSSSVSQRESAAVAMRRNNSPTPYANNFVPETKTNSNSSNGSNSRNQQLQQQQQRQQHQLSSSSPSYSNHVKPHNSNGSSIVPNNINEDCSNRKSNSISSSSNSSRSRHHSSSGRNNGGVADLSSKHSRSSTPSQKHTSKHNNSHYNSNSNLSQHQQQQQQQPMTAVVSASVSYNGNARTPPQQTAMHSSNFPEEQQQQQQHPSPTQQIAAAASALTNHPSSNAGDEPRFDFSRYTPITSIEQRRKYKTEFEQNYDEYRKLLAQIESVGQRFRELAERLNRVQQGCPDYYNIKDQIVSEYNRIRKEEAINRDKQRFDYLHEKLAHIKQLVMDYDKKLTSGIATAVQSQAQNGQLQMSTTPVAGQQHQQEQQQSSYHNNTNGSTAHLSPMLQSSGESNHSPPLMIINSNDTVNGTATTTESSSYATTKKSSKHHHKQQQYLQHQHLEETTQYQQEHYQHEHHDPETIQEVDGEQSHHSYNPTNWNQNMHHHHPQQQQQNIELSQMKQNHQNTNTNDSDSESDSSSSTSSNEDNSDDDNSDVSDEDDNSDDDSNDDDDDEGDDDGGNQ